MPDYLIQLVYAPETVATLVANPQNREEMSHSIIENLGENSKVFGSHLAITTWWKSQHYLIM